MKGRHENRPLKNPDEMIQDVIAHISKFPTIDSHYCRASSNKKYLEDGLSTALMYRMYVNKKIPNYYDVSEKNNVNENEEDADENEDERSEIDGEERSEINEDERTNTDKILKEQGQNEEQKKSNNLRKNKKIKRFDVTDERVVRLSKYREIFNTKFNYGFFKPKKDL